MKHLSRLALVAAATFSISATTLAQESTGPDIDPLIFNMYLESRIQAPASQATADQIEAVRVEVVDLYLLSDAPGAVELQNDPRIAAQIELQTRTLLAQAVLANYLAENPATEEELKAVYDEQIKAAPPLEFKARHILLETQGAAVAVIAELEGGADFVELAKEKSTGPTGPTGGDLGWFPPDRMVPEFSAAVQTLADGAFTTAPVQTQFGWHVILREGSREAAPPPFDSVRDVLRQNVDAEKLQAFMESLRN